MLRMIAKLTERRKTSGKKYRIVSVPMDENLKSAGLMTSPTKSRGGGRGQDAGPRGRLRADAISANVWSGENLGGERKVHRRHDDVRLLGYS
jgi:hypothetical protein